MRKIFLTMINVVFLTMAYLPPVYASGEDELLGLGIGGALGGLFGNQFGHGAGRVATTTAGVFVGGWTGDNIARSLNRNNGIYPSGSGTPYAPIDLFNSPSPPYAPNYVAPPAPDPSSIYMGDSYGAYCRDLLQQVRVGSQIQARYGTACLQPDGSWRLVQ